MYVQGEVVKPGRYPLTTNMRVADLIRVGGGSSPARIRKRADLTTYQWSRSRRQIDRASKQEVALSAALAGDSNSNVPLHNGDVLTIRQLPGWNDLGASIALKGEVKHPGPTASVPASGSARFWSEPADFQPDAYPYGAVLQETQVRELESKARNEMILRVKDAQSNLRTSAGHRSEAKAGKKSAMQQWQDTLEQLSANPPLGRVTIRISSQDRSLEKHPGRHRSPGGRYLIVPKRPSYVMVTGQVFNPTAVSFRPGKSAKWYLSQSGGPTQSATRKRSL